VNLETRKNMVVHQACRLATEAVLNVAGFPHGHENAAIISSLTGWQQRNPSPDASGSEREALPLLYVAVTDIRALHIWIPLGRRAAVS
jgi:hypothetical protein